MVENNYYNKALDNEIKLFLDEKQDKMQIRSLISKENKSRCT